MSKRTQLAFFKPYQNKGAAFFAEFSPARKDKSGKDMKAGLFFSMMPELENRKFNSKKKLTMSIGVGDFGDLVAVLTGRKGGLGTFKDDKWSNIYHEVKGKHSSSLTLIAKDDGNGYLISIGRKTGNDVVRYSINLTIGEACTLLEYLRLHAWMFFESTYVPQGTTAPAGDVKTPSADIPF